MWLPLIGVRGFLGNYLLFDTLLLTILINALLLLDLIIDLTNSKLRVGYIFLIICFSSFIIFFNKQALAFFDIMLAVYLLRKLPFHKFLNSISWMAVVNLIIFVFCFLFSIKENQIIIMPKGEAFNLGFNNTNTASSFLMINLMVLVLWVYIKNRITSFLFIPLFYLIYDWTLARASFFAEIVFYFSVLLSFLNIKNYFFRFIPLILYLLIFMMTYYSRSYAWINEVFTTRFYIYDTILSDFDIFNLVFGYSIPEGQPMDSSYLSLLFDGGIFYVIIFLYIYDRYYKYQISKNFIKYFPFVFFVLIAGFSENTFSGLNFVSIIFFKLMYDKNIIR